MINVDRKHIEISVECSTELERFLYDLNSVAFEKAQIETDLTMIFIAINHKYSKSVGIDIITHAIKKVYEDGFDYVSQEDLDDDNDSGN